MNVQFSKLLENATREPKALAWMLLFAASVIYVVYWTGVIIYRLTLHPLARFPGPFLCRISSIQQIYYEAILTGQFLDKLPEYHRKYGPVVRLNPDHVHIMDPAVFHEIYKQNTPFTKDPIVTSLGMSSAITMTLPVHAHRMKRQTLSPCFSERRVNMLEDGLYEELERLFKKIGEYEDQDEEVPIQDLYYCYTGDIISRYLFGKNLDLILAPDYQERVGQMRSFTQGIWFAVHFQLIRLIVLSMPQWLETRLNGAWTSILRFCEGLAKDAIAQYNEDKISEKMPGEETIYDRLLTDSARRREKGQDSKPLTVQELTDESAAILNAGTEPTATMMAYATYFFVKFPETQKRILEELGTVGLDEHGRMPLKSIEALPYFTGFVRETLRLIPLVPGRLPRIVPKGGLYVPSIKDTIPEGTSVGMSHIFIHQDPDIFERPLEFLPERWIGESGKELNHWLLSFSKGRTDCIGKGLAYAEMHLVLANLFTRFNLELTPGSHEGMEWVDMVVLRNKKNLCIKVKAKGIKAAS